jgi:hypothetical protein
MSNMSSVSKKGKSSVKKEIVPIKLIPLSRSRQRRGKSEEVVEVIVTQAQQPEELSKFFIASRSGLEGRAKIPSAEYAYPFLVDYRPIRFLTDVQRAYLDTLVLSFSTLQLAYPERVNKDGKAETSLLTTNMKIEGQWPSRGGKIISLQYDTIATILAEYLSFMASIEKFVGKAASMKLAPGLISFEGKVDLQEDLASLMFGNVDPVRPNLIHQRYQPLPL